MGKQTFKLKRSIGHNTKLISRWPITFKAHSYYSKNTYEKILASSYLGGGFGYEFSASAGFNTDAAEMSSGDFLYIISQAVCQNYYSVIDFTNSPPFDPGFISKAETLADPENGDEAVLEFIKYYGTHFMTQATYGAKFVQHHKVSQTTFESLKRSEFSVEAQANYAGLISVGGGISLDSDQKKAASNFLKQVQTTTYTVGSTPPSNGDAMTWAASVKQNPVPMQYTLSPIDLLFTEPFVKELPPGFDYTAVRQKLKNSSQLYCQALKQQGMVHSCEDYFQLETQGVDIYELGTALILITCSASPAGNSYFCFPRVSMFPKVKPRKILRFEGNKINCFLRDQSSSDIRGNSLNLAVTAVFGQHSRVTVHCYPLTS